jgi:hypothetical protein
VRRWGGLLAVVLLAAACSDGGGSEQADAEPLHLELTAPDRCEFVGDGDHCLLPFPSDWFTVADDSTDTGRRVALDPASMPANVDGTGIDPSEQNRNDGFSPGTPILVEVPGLDAEASGITDVTDIGASLDEDAPIVLLDSETGERHPWFAELDSRDDTDPTLIIRPARDFAEGHRVDVAVRGLVDQDGDPIEPSDAFRALRDGTDTDVAEVNDRRDAIERTLGELDDAGVARDDLVLAWDFTVASERDLSERLLGMRDDAFAALGDGSPTFTVDQASGRPGQARTVSGTYEVPLYLTGRGGPGEVLNNGDGPGDDPVPRRNGRYEARFLCTIPAGGDSTAPVLYGHGLLGSAEEILAAGPLFGAEHGITLCATDWIGMSSGDLGNVAAILGDLSGFRSLADRLLQAHLDFLFLGRLMVHPDGFASDPAFQGPDGESRLDPEGLALLGNSQGGILGGATTAVAQDWTRAFLGVPAMNYSTLLQRSIDFDEYGALLEQAYPDPADQLLAISLVQMLWDRGENQGYAQHLVGNPYADTPGHEVLLFEAFGDHQVANVATETMARTLGIPVRQPALDDGRSTAVEPMWGLDATGPLPLPGSALVIWDFGTPAPPDTNQPNRRGDDPHGAGSEVPEVRELAATFLVEGEVVEVCGGDPCRTEQD